MKLNVAFILVSILAIIFLAEVEGDLERDERCPSNNKGQLLFLQNESDCKSFYICDHGYSGSLLSLKQNVSGNLKSLI